MRYIDLRARPHGFLAKHRAERIGLVESERIAQCKFHHAWFGQGAGI
jgi:hypothetical protein